MAETGKLGSADSLLGNLLPAFAGADDGIAIDGPAHWRPRDGRFTSGPIDS